MQFIYSLDLNPPEKVEDACRLFFESQGEARDYYSFSEELIFGYLDRREEVDAAIQERASNWSFDRIAKVDLAILRLAIYELLFREDIPPVVTINEAIDLSKEFSSDDSRRFVNGILDAIAMQTLASTPGHSASERE